MDGFVVSLVPMALSAGVVLLVAGVLSRRVAVRDAGLAAMVAAIVAFAWIQPPSSRWWAVLVAPGLALVAELAHLSLDGRRRSSSCAIEPAVWRAAAAGAVMVGALATLAALLVAVAVPSGTLPAGLLPAAMAVGVVALGMVALALHRLGPRRMVGRRPAVLLAAVLLAVVAGTVVVGAGAAARTRLLSGSTAASPPSGSSAGGAAAADEGAEEQSPAADRPVRDVGAVTGWVTIAAALVGVVLLVRFGSRDGIVPPEDLVPDPQEGAVLPATGLAVPDTATVDRAATVAAVDAALVQLRGDHEPRLAVRVAYATVAAGLGRSELQRAPAETEGEYLQRVIDQLGGRGASLAPLTDLFERARFSDEPVDDEMRADALALLERVRQEVASAP